MMRTNAEAQCVRNAVAGGSVDEEPYDCGDEYRFVSIERVSAVLKEGTSSLARVGCDDGLKDNSPHSWLDKPGGALHLLGLRGWRVPLNEVFGGPPERLCSWASATSVASTRARSVEGRADSCHDRTEHRLY